METVAMVVVTMSAIHVQRVHLLVAINFVAIERVWGRGENMNTLQAEKLRDLIAFLEKLGASEITVRDWSDNNDCLSMKVDIAIWKKAKP
jgi:hypothetical protein